MIDWRRIFSTFLLVLMAGSPAVAGPLDFLEKTGSNSAGIPSVDAAFKLELDHNDETLGARWTILDGVYLYRDRIKFSSPNPKVKIGKPQFPPATIKEEKDYDGKPLPQSVYYKSAEVFVNLLQAPAGPVTIQVEYQGCEESKGICYQMVQKTFTINLAAAIEQVEAVTSPPRTAAKPESENENVAAEEQTDEQRFIRVLKEEHAIIALLLAFVFGAGLALTPCSYPVIPLVSAVIMGNAQHVSRGRLVALSLAYVLGIVVVYAAVGALFAWIGSNIFGDAQSPWVLAPIGIMIVVFALSMYGLFNIQLPARLQSKLNDVSAQQQGGSLGNVFLIGVLSALIMGACTTPFVAAALTFISQSGNVLYGSAAMAMLGAGQGAPLILIAAIAGFVLPKAGSWMDTVKTLLATMLLAGAILIAGRMFEPTAQLLLWGVWFAILGVQLGAFTPITKPGPMIAAKGLGIAALLWSAILLLGVATGGTQWARPLHKLIPAKVIAAPVTTAQANSVSAEPLVMKYEHISDIDVLQRHLADAKKAQRPVFLSITAPEWCVSCRINERDVLSKPEIIAAYQPFARLEINLDKKSADEAQMLRLLNLQMGDKHPHIVGPPVMLFYDKAGKLHLSLSGKVTSARLLGVANKLSQ